MNRLFFIIFLVMLLKPAFPQYEGGNGDGFDRETGLEYLFNPVICFGGGPNDGSDHATTGYHTMFDQSFYMAGGINDGFSLIHSSVESICDPVIFASGGIGDGFRAGYYYGPIVFSPAWQGGNDDGNALSYMQPSTLSPLIYCFGGTNDGAFSLVMAPTYFGPGVWLGIQSTSWENPANWSGNLAPDVSVDVIVPAEKPFYPVIYSGGLSVNSEAAWFKCKSLTIQEGGSVNNKSDLYLFGEMTVSGLYLADNPPSNHIYIFQGGNLLIKQPGQVTIGQ